MKRNPKKALLVMLALVMSSLFGVTATARAQDQGQLQQTQPAMQPAWTANQLDNLVAPIALYPDPLLSQMLVASTYPLEVVEANQWLDRNKNLQGQALIDAAKQQPWDPSIQTLVAVPDALAKLDEDIQWTTDLGNAFLAQEADVMNAVQRMRIRAEADGHLASTKQQKVITRYDGGQQVVVIEPAYPDVIYVPVYDPFYIWGPPVYGFYPALYYPRYGFGFGIGFNIGFCFSDWGGWGYWGWGPSWQTHTILVNNYFFNRYGFRHHWNGGDHDRTVWVHNPVHRLSVPYRNPQVAARFAGHSTRYSNSRNAELRQNDSRMRFSNRSDNRFAGRNQDQAIRNAPVQAQRNQNSSRERYQSAPQNQIAGRNQDRGVRNAPVQAQRNQNSSRERYRSAPQNQIASNRNRTTAPVQRYQTQPQSRSQAQRQYRSDQQRYNESPRVVPFGSTQRQSEAPRQYRSNQQIFRTPEVQRYQSAPRQTFREPQQDRARQQIFRAPQAQQYRFTPQQRFQSSPQFRSAPQMSAPRFNGGGSNRGGGGRSGRTGGRGR